MYVEFSINFSAWQDVRRDTLQLLSRFHFGMILILFGNRIQRRLYLKRRQIGMLFEDQNDPSDDLRKGSTFPSA